MSALLKQVWRPLLALAAILVLTVAMIPNTAHASEPWLTIEPDDSGSATILLSGTRPTTIHVELTRTSGPNIAGFTPNKAITAHDESADADTVSMVASNGSDRLPEQLGVIEFDGSGVVALKASADVVKDGKQVTWDTVNVTVTLPGDGTTDGDGDTDAGGDDTGDGDQNPGGDGDADGGDQDNSGDGSDSGNDTPDAGDTGNGSTGDDSKDDDTNADTAHPDAKPENETATADATRQTVKTLANTGAAFAMPTVILLMLAIGAIPLIRTMMISRHH